MLKRLIQLHLAVLAGLITASGSPTSARLQDDAATSERTGDHFHVICHFENDEVAEQALEAVEAMWTSAKKIYKLPKGKLKELLPVNLYRTAEDYEAADEKLTGGHFKRNQAFADHDTRTAHVALQPPLDDKSLERVGLPTLTRRLLAHEAAHLVRFLYMPGNYRQHPDWLVHGSATWLDIESMKTLHLALDDESDPFRSNQINLVQKLLATDDLPTAREIFTGQLDELEFYEKYSIAELFFRFLLESKRKRSLGKLIDTARRLGGGPGYEESLQSHVDKTFNEEKMATLTEEFREYIAEFEPEWSEVYRSLARRGDDWLQCAFANKNAVAWRTQPVDRDEYTVRGNLEILPTGTQQLNLLLNRSDSGFVSIAFSSNFGISVFDYASESNTWNLLLEKEVRRLDEFAFEVHVDGLDLTISVEGRDVLKVDLPRKLTGPWGLGAQKGSVGFWRNLKIGS